MKSELVVSVLKICIIWRQSH